MAKWYVDNLNPKEAKKTARKTIAPPEDLTRGGGDAVAEEALPTVLDTTAEYDHDGGIVPWTTDEAKDD